MSEKHSDKPLDAAASRSSQATPSSSPSGGAPAESSTVKGEAAKPGPAPADAASAEKGTSAADSLLSEIADLASKGAQQGRRNADEVAERVLPAIRLGLGKASYSTGYYVSFGLVLTGKLIVDMLPGSSALRHGINDGGAAAEQAFAVRKDREKATQGTAAAPAAV